MKKVAVLRGADKIAPVFYMLGKHAHIIGGFVRWMVSPNQDPAPPGDIDLYPHSADDFVKVRELLLKHFKLEKDSKGKTIHTTDISESYTLAGGQKLQVINPVNHGMIVASGGMEAIINNFDFTVCRAGLVSLQEALVDDDFIRDEMRKHLVIKEIHCPIGAVKRIGKYCKKGYYISPAEIYKLFDSWEQRLPDYKLELKEAIQAVEALRDGGTLEGMNFSALTEGDDVRKVLAKLIYID